MTEPLSDVLWPVDESGEALLAATRAVRLPHRNVSLRRLPAKIMRTPSDNNVEQRLSHWIESAARHIGLEANAVCAEYSAVRSLVESCAPAMLRIKTTEYDGLLVIVGRRRNRLRIIRPDLATSFVDVGAVESAMRSPLDAEHAGVIDRLLDDIDLSARRRQTARAALLQKRLSRDPVGRCWLLRVSGRNDVSWSHWLPVLLGAHVIDQMCWIVSWWVLGWMTFTGRLDTGWLVAWSLLLACIIPFRLLSEAAGGYLSLEFNVSLRRRLLTGTLQLDPDEVRTSGAGSFIGRALEVDSLEQLALTGGLQSLLSGVELISAFVVLGPIAGQWLLALLLAAIVAASVAQAAGLFKQRMRWTKERLALTAQLVERLVGHRTTVAQEPEQDGLRAADRAIDRYGRESQVLDGSFRRLQVIPTRVWLLAALLVLSPSFATGETSVTSLAVAMAGILFARQGLQRLLEGLDRIVGAGVSWKQLKQFLDAARRPVEAGDPDFSVCEAGEQQSDASHHSNGEASQQPVVVEGRKLMFRHPNRNEPVLNGVDITIRRRDRILLQGASGGGKSTLAAVLAGSRIPTSGVRLLQGLDQPTLGENWRRRVVLAPQFHDNHVLMGTFLYNLLLGRNWPPSEQDVQQAEEVCRELELGPLLDRMPGGLLQMVGETGWQLSHGERSRLFLARALLQESDMMILDESFAALDPVTLRQILPRIIRRGPAMIVIAHTRGRRSLVFNDLRYSRPE